MPGKVPASISFILFQLICLSLIFGLALYRADISHAQESEADVAVAIPRDNSLDDDDEGDEGDDDAEDDRIYVVKPGDTLWRISRSLGIPLSILAAQADNPSRIYPGQVFRYSMSGMSLNSSQSSGALPGSGSQLSGGGLQTYQFTVRPGDTLSHISIWLGIPLAELSAQLDNPRLILPGQVITYVSETQVESPPLVRGLGMTDNDGNDSPASQNGGFGANDVDDDADTGVAGSGTPPPPPATDEDEQDTEPVDDEYSNVAGDDTPPPPPVTDEPDSPPDSEPVDSSIAGAV